MSLSNVNDASAPNPLAVPIFYVSFGIFKETKTKPQYFGLNLKIENIIRIQI